MNFIKVYMDTVKENNAEFSLYYDGEFKKLHILDKDRDGTMTVTNTAGRSFFEKIDAILFINHKEAASWAEYDIYLYGTDGIICEYDPETNGFLYVAATDPHLYEPFKKVCAHRYMETLDKN